MKELGKWLKRVPSSRLSSAGRLALLGAAAAALAACSVDAVTFTPPEDCEAVGDEDGDGAADCDDPSCASSTACAPACTDAVQNGDEADVDCGGSCSACGDGAKCGANGDCDSGLCGAGSCVRRSSCKEILAGGLSIGDGSYGIDPDGAGGEPAFPVKCDMTTDGGGWTRFHWVAGAYPANADPLEQSLSRCASSDVVCRARIPAAVTPSELMVKDLGDGDVALWRFDAANAISKAVLAALRDKTTGCLAQQVPWQPYFYSGTESFCGTGGEGGCDSFVYVDTAGVGCQSYTGWYLQLDGDTGCHNAAFKMGMTHPGFESQGCELATPDVNYLDDGPTTLDDQIGELYFR
jgi:hypothetical protein